MRHFHPRVLLSLLFAALLGIASVILPVWLLALKPCQAPLFPILRTGVEGMSAVTLGFLFCSGLLLGLFGRGHPFLLGLTTLALLPCAAIAEIVVSPTSHSMWPVEFAIYGLISLIAGFGAFAGRYLKKKFRKCGE